MPNRGRSRNRRRSRRGGRRMPAQIPATAQEYRGPIRLPLAKRQEDCVETELSYIAQVASNGSGVIAAGYAMSLVFFDEEASFAALWDEYRVLAVLAEWIPMAQNCADSVARAYSPLCMAIDRDSSVAPSTLSQLWDFSSAVCKCINQPLKVTARMSGSEDAQFFPIATSAPISLKLIAGGLTNSTNYGYLAVKAIFQFRGRVK